MSRRVEILHKPVPIGPGFYNLTNFNGGGGNIEIKLRVTGFLSGYFKHFNKIKTGHFKIEFL